jgi:hypothetical protein
MEKLDYLSDFIHALKNEEGVKSMYFEYFLQHYYHCNKIIRTKDSSTTPRIIRKNNFIINLEKLKVIEDLKNSDYLLTNKDSLTRMIMENELRFDFENSKLKFKANK